MFEKPVISLGIDASGFIPLIEIFQFDAKDCGLEGIDPAVDADNLVIILRLHAVNAKDAKSGGELVIVCGHQTAVAGSAKVL